MVDFIANYEDGMFSHVDDINLLIMLMVMFWSR